MTHSKKKGLKATLTELNQLIASFEELVRLYPKNVNYQRTLDDLLQERAVIAATIGKAKR